MRRGVLVGTVVVLACLLLAGSYRAASFTWRVATELDRAEALAELAPRPQTTVVYDRLGRQAFTFFVEQRIDVALDRVAPVMVDALLAVEDKRFFVHHGLDPVRIAGAAWQNLRSRRIAEGGSTITQQLARATQLTPRRTFERKLREALISARLEARYTKQQILEAYLNTVYFGEGYYGVEAAAQGYFAKPSASLDTAEAALLAALIRSPSLDAPCVSPQRAGSRRDLVLRLMRDQGRIDEAEYRAALSSPLPDPSHGRQQASSNAVPHHGRGLYFQEELRRQLVAEFGNDRVLRGGLRIYSTYDPSLQQAAEQAVSRRIAEIAGRHARARDLQGALVTIDPATGDVLALVGGRDFAASSFNRATQARRQAGSAFKPILYAAALERGFSPATVLTDLDRVIGTGRDAWLPGGEHEAAAYTLRRALKVSSNRAAAQLLQQVGTSTTAYYAQRLGIASPLPLVPSLALGTGEVTLMELTAAYTAFANRGEAAAPRLFTRVEDSRGSVLYAREPRLTRALSEATAYLMTTMLADAVSGGTATGVRAAGFKLPAAGKTGTTNDYADAWFIGYTPRLVTGVWFGFDKPAPIMNRGFAGTVAVPAWARFMTAAAGKDRTGWFAMPASVERVAVCRRSGARATPHCHHQVIEPERPVGTFGIVSASYRDDADTPVVPSEPPVFEELFAAGTISSEHCALHTATNTVALSGEIQAAVTPTVDAALGAGGIRRIVGTDGVVRYVRQ